ncbi:MAG: CsgE family curli-type amyloid fiber assembly protein [Bacteroidota bacterium]|nr:CsgE family curli-type amyloid fiber assembly protein [Bacteroidota bacterium]
MKRFKYLIAFVCLIGAFTSAQESLYNRTMAAEIVLEQQAENIVIKALAVNKTQVDTGISYKFTVFTKDSLNNSSKNEQKGNGVVKAGIKALLGTTQVGINIPEEIKIMVLIYDQLDQLIGKKIETIAPYTTQLVTANQYRNDDEYLGFRGIVTNKTRTKPGKDFYIEFFRLYKKYNVNSDKIVVVREVFGQGRTSQIQIQVGFTKLEPFVLSPQKKYIEYMASRMLQLVYIELQKMKEKETREY